MVDGTEPVRPFDTLLFPKIFQAFRISIQPSKLVIAFAAIVVICVAGWLMDSISPTVVVGQHGFTELDLYMDNFLPSAMQLALLQDTGERIGVFAALGDFTARHLRLTLLSLAHVDPFGVGRNIAFCFLALAWAFTNHFIYSIIFFTIALAVLSVAGGAISRIAALQFAHAEKPGMTEALRFGLRKFASLFTAPITPIAIIFIIGIFIILLGLWGNIPVVGELSVGLLLPLALAVAGIIAVMIVGLAGGFSFMFPTIAYEDSDCFDAISRSFSYVYARPWHAAFYAIVAFVYGAICYVFVRLFLFLVLWATYAFLAMGFLRDNAKLHAIWPATTFDDFLGSGPDTAASASTSAAAFLVHLWILAVIGLMVAFVISFYYSACTIIYALLRNRVDRIALEEVYTYSNMGASEPSPGETGAAETSAQAESQPHDNPPGQAETST